MLVSLGFLNGDLHELRHLLPASLRDAEMGHGRKAELVVEVEHKVVRRTTAVAQPRAVVGVHPDHCRQVDVSRRLIDRAAHPTLAGVVLQGEDDGAARQLV